jgi:hypothetical protein
MTCSVRHPVIPRLKNEFRPYGLSYSSGSIAQSHWSWPAA